MEIITEHLSVATRGNSDIIDITPQISSFVAKSKLKEGNVTVFVSGSTASVTTTEYEPGLIKDIPAAMERLAPQSITYHHNETWHDGNGHSHVRASMMGPSLTVPFSKGELLLGTWQQIVLIDFDTRARKREIVVQLMGNT
ncbi:MAG: YjbQ family protein [Ignavibacteriales bacterium]|nr:YjbQ family protein [Ignavibacteriales bacterium]